MKNNHPRDSAAPPARQPETLYLTAPIVRTHRSLCQVLRRGGLPISEPYSDVVAVRLDRVSTTAKRMMGPEERRVVRCRIAAGIKGQRLRGRLRNGPVVTGDNDRSGAAAKLPELAEELQVGTMVEGAETVGNWRWAVGHGADDPQGYRLAPAGPHPPQSQSAGLARSSESQSGELPTSCEQTTDTSSAPTRREQEGVSHVPPGGTRDEESTPCQPWCT